MQDAKPGTMARSNCQTGCCGSTPPAADASATTPCTVNAEPEEPTTPKAEKMLGGGCSTGAKEGGSGGKARVSCCSPGAGACASDDNTPVAVEAPARVAGASGSQGGCCASSPEAPPNCQGSQAGPARDDAGGLAKAPSKESCQDGCCGKTQDVPPVAVQPEPPCCEGKQKPCCSDECIDRIALRECEKRCRRASHARARSSTEDGQASASSACGYHARTTRKTYAARLAAIGCICRALVALGQQSCCATTAAGPAGVGRREKTRAASPASRKASQAKNGGTATSTGRGGPSSGPSGGQPGCCEGKPGTKSKSGCKSDGGKDDDDGGVTRVAALGKSAGAEDGCCGSETAGKARGQESSKADVDVEKGVSGADHVVLCITGMTCTGCETKLNRTLGSFPGVSNLKTSLVMSRAEFGLNPGAASVADVMRHIERTTEFKCEKISTEGASIDVLPPGDLQAWLQQPMPPGVHGVEILDKNTARISFDPTIIGARDLVEKSSPQPLRLAPLRGDAGLHAGSAHVRHVGYMTALSAILTIPVLALAWAPLVGRPITYGAVSLALATVVQVVIAGPFYPKALKSLVFSRMIEMDLLIVLSTSAAYVFSVVSFGYLVRGEPLSTGEFFETSTLLVTLIMVGRYVSALARQKAVESISIRSLQQSSATLVSEAGADERDIDTRLLQYGDVFKIRPDTRAPTDGVVVSGASEADESMLTGESRPVEKQPGSSIIAGTINGPGTLVVRLTRLPGENTISTIAGMVDGAKLSKPKIQDLADRVASYFVPGVVALTIVVFAVWIAVGILGQKLTGSEAAVQATTYAITVLIVSCPCAIGLAVPMVIVIASGVAAQRGIIFKSASGIEIAHKATHIVLDKTGTITEGRLAVVADETLAGASGVTASTVLGLVAGIKHPVSAAVAAYLTAKGVRPLKVKDVQSLAGKGVEGYAGNKRIRAGNMRWLGLEAHPQAQDVASRGHTVFCVTVDSLPVAIYGLADTIRPEAAAVIAALRARGIEITILSGDDEGAVAAVAQALGLGASHARARCSPADKAAHVRGLLASAAPPAPKQAPPVVLFVGDGTNDAPALAQATLGVHLARPDGADVAASAADVVLLGPSLTALAGVLDVSRAAVRRIAFNFAWSFVYNALAVLLAAGAFVAAGRGAVRIPPEYAGLGELVSVLPVIVVAVALRWARI